VNMIIEDQHVNNVEVLRFVNTISEDHNVNNVVVVLFVNTISEDQDVNNVVVLRFVSITGIKGHVKTVDQECVQIAICFKLMGNSAPLVIQIQTHVKDMTEKTRNKNTEIFRRHLTMYLIHDKAIGTSCNYFDRPDIVAPLDDRIVIIEVDENAHQSKKIHRKV